ncbi:MAG: FtsX-like permease family protein [Chloroflexota bacterium]
MGIVTRAVRNISRRKIRALLVIIALGFSMAIMISIPAGVNANQQSTVTLSQNLANTISQTEANINQTLTEIDCSLASGFEGFGFRSSSNIGFNPGQFGGSPPGNFTPGQFGGGRDIPGQFGAGPFGGGSSTPMNESLYEDIANISNVAAVVPILQVSEGTNTTVEMMGRTFTRMIADYIIVGLPIDSTTISTYPILPTNMTSGRNLQSGETGVVVLSENNSAFFKAGVGDTITILDNTFKVVGIHGSSGMEDSRTLYMSLSDAQSITNNTGYVTSLKVFATDSGSVTTISSAISSLHTELQVTTSQERLSQLQAMQTSYQTALNNSEATIAQTQSIALEEVGVATAATSLIVLFLMLYTVRERTKEIGTLKAIGFSNSNVMSQFLLEGVLLSLFAGVVGILISAFAAPMLSGLLLPAASQAGLPIMVGRGGAATNPISATAAVTLTPELIAIAVGAAVLLGALGSLYPAWRASRTRPAEAMKYE